MNQFLFSQAVKQDLENFLLEDDIDRNHYYIQKLPSELVECTLYAKSSMVVAGLPYFWEVFRLLGMDPLPNFEELEGKSLYLKNGEKEALMVFKAPFGLALQAERLSLNLLQRASSVASFTKRFVDKAKKYNVAILDTRKTTPGLRSLEKYAVRVGGGFNHRFGQADTWMIKDNHKKYFGGLKPAVDFFQAQGSFYQNLVVEIHSLEELKTAQSLGLKFVMLDNFSPDLLKQAVAMKQTGMSYEISGGIRLDNIENYLMEGIDAVSIGALTYGAPAVDLSLKMARV